MLSLDMYTCHLNFRCFVTTNVMLCVGAEDWLGGKRFWSERMLLFWSVNLQVEGVGVLWFSELIAKFATEFMR